MRVVGGSLKGRRLTPVKGARTRPTSDKVREAVFNVLSASGPFTNVLDLFAGTGAMGIEALSRGAERAVFVENDRTAAETIKKNIEAVGLTEQTSVIKRPVAAFLKAAAMKGASFDLIFADPPYEAGEAGLYEETLGLIESRVLLSPGGTLVVEASSRMEPVECGEGLTLKASKKYGDTAVYYFKRAE